MAEKLKILLIELLACTIFFIGWLCFRTSKISIEGKEIISEIRDSEKPVIFAFWHGRFFPMGFVKPNNRKACAIISKHTDGEIITRVVKKMGVSPIRGSTNRIAGESGKAAKDKGGVGALRNVIKSIKAGHNIAFTPDGPTGPERKFKPNILFAAANTGAKIYPVSFSCKHPVFLKTWDKFCIPVPFNHIKIMISEGYEIPEEITNEQSLKTASEIEQKLNELTDKADYHFNHI